MLPDDDARHGTNAGYVAGCRQECCKTGHANYKRNRRTRVYLAHGPMKVDGTGSRRRVRALVALGYTMEAIDKGLGRARGYTFRMTKHGEVFRSTADEVAKLYDAWSMTIPPTTPISRRNRALAQRKGWPPPLAWDDDRIDDPTYKPRGGRPTTRRTDVDDVIVERLMAGERASATRAERNEAMRRWKAMGRSERSLCEVQGWKDGRYGRSVA